MFNHAPQLALNHIRRPAAAAAADAIITITIAIARAEAEVARTRAQGTRQVCLDAAAPWEHCGVGHQPLQDTQRAFYRCSCLGQRLLVRRA